MYQVDEKDQVVELKGIPQSSVGAPTPIVLSNEGKTVLAYYLENVADDWDGSSVRVVGSNSEEPAAIVEFDICDAYMFGPPNDEAFSGHPLASRGLAPYGVYEVLNSSWIRGLERMNSAHHYHKPERFWQRHHFVFAFHDSTFECVADRFEITETFGSMESIVSLMAQKLWAR
jgi:hypothetical protein